VIVSEVHYDPGPVTNANELEFVEIYNRGSSAVNLANWKLRKGVDFDFTDSRMLGGHETLVIVPFDPVTDANQVTAFRSQHNITASIAMVGPYGGQLENNGERVRLQRPDEPPAGEPGYYPGLLEDEIVYDDAPPWPGGAAGGGDSLNRSAASTWGGDVTNWSAATPTPGSGDFPETTVVGRHIFYNNTAFDAAIATDKKPLLPGDIATFANYTSYSKGINGVAIDISELSDNVTLTEEDFTFRIGNSNAPSSWASAPALNGIAIGEDVGEMSSDRILLAWPDNAIQNQWLQVTVKATENTGLAEPDIFYFGNAIGEAGNQTRNTIVNATDEIVARNFQHNALNPALIDDPYDYNRDGLVNGTDQIIARENQTNPLTMLRLITAPAADAAVQQTSQETPRPPLAALDWQYEFKSTQSKAAKRKDVEATVDLLLATEWQ